MKLSSLRNLFLCLLVGSVRVVAQDKPSIIPPSPKSAEYAKYITYNVSPYNGLPEITIPLYSISLKGLSIPINLSYHASGIKYRQDNGDVGVGWTLNPGYRVSRTVCGYADERELMPNDFSEAENNRGVTRDKYLSRFLPLGVKDRPCSVLGEQLDGEYDMFNYNLLFDNGSFIISDRSKKEVKTIDQSRTKVEYSTGAAQMHGITGFKLIDENGNNYFFGKEISETANNVFELSDNGYDGGVTTAWALTDFISSLGEKVEFRYGRGYAGGWQMNWSNRISEAYSIPPYVTYLSEQSEDNTGQDGGYQTFALDEIQAPDEQIQLFRETTAAGTLLVGIKVYSNSRELQRSIQFFYTSGSYHVFLDSVQIRDSDDTRVETYKFDYNSKVVSNYDNYTADQWGYYLATGNERRVYHKEFELDQIRVQDGGLQPMSQYIAGVMRDVGTDDLFSLKSITYPTGGKIEYEYESNKYTDLSNKVLEGGGLRIKTIKSYDKANGETMVRKFAYGESDCGYGKLTAAVDYRNFINETVLFRNFDGLATDGFPQRVITYNTSMQGDIGMAGSLSSFVKYPTVTEYYSAQDQLSYDNGGKTVYRYDMGSPLGENTYPTEIYPDYGFRMLYAHEYPRYISRYSFWNKPELVEKLTYKRITDNEYKAITKETFQYSAENVEAFTGLKVRPFVSIDTRESEFSSANVRYYSFFSSFFKSGLYTIQTGKNLLKKKREILYSDNDSVVTVRTFDYNTRNQVGKETLKGSKGEDIITYYRYPQDIISDPSSIASVSSKPISFLVERNNISSPLEVVKTTLKAGVENVTDVRVTTYRRSLINRSNANYYTSLPFEEYRLESSEPVLKSSYIPFHVNNINEEINTLDTKLKSKLTFDRYDLYGNLEQYTLNGRPTAYQWGYNGRFPVIEAINAKSSEIYIENFEQAGNTLASHTGKRGFTGSFTPGFIAPNAKKYRLSWFSFTDGRWVLNETDYMGQTLSGVIDDIRIYPSNAQISTYTYEVFKGMSSSSDAKGQAAFYDYDKFGRLEKIKDQNGNVVKRNLYHYSDGVSVYYCRERDVMVSRNSCPKGYTSSASVRYMVPAGAYSSTISQIDADDKALSDLNMNAQNYANANCGCLLIYYNAPVSANFTRTNCPIGSPTGPPVTYTVLGGAYSSTISQADANAKAQQDIASNGQNYANTHGSCGLYLNMTKGDYFSRNNCQSGYVAGNSIYYEVKAGTYTSTISQADADQQAQKDIEANGQSYANVHGECNALVSFSIQASMYSGTISRIRLYQVSTEYSTVFDLNENGAGQIFQIPEGTYRVVFEMTEDSNGERYLVFSGNDGSGACRVISGSVEFADVPLNGNYNQFTIMDYCAY